MHFVLDKETLITIGMLRPSMYFNPWWKTEAKQFKDQNLVCRLLQNIPSINL